MDKSDRATLEKVFETLKAAAPMMDEVNRAHILGYGEAIIDIKGPAKKEDETKDAS